MILTFDTTALSRLLDEDPAILQLVASKQLGGKLLTLDGDFRHLPQISLVEVS